MASSIDFRAVYASVLTDWLCADEVDVSNSIIGPSQTFWDSDWDVMGRKN